MQCRFFFDLADDGGLALAFSDHVLEFYGLDIGSARTMIYGVDPPFVPNVDDTYIDEGAALGSVTFVPEPEAWAFMLLGASAIGAVFRAAGPRPFATGAI